MDGGEAVNIYTQHFTAKCASNNRLVSYALTIESHVTIMVEDIQAECDKLQSGYHEQFADDLFARFGGRQTISAHRHGTDITTIRP
jgi:hypothetical protein